MYSQWPEPAVYCYNDKSVCGCMQIHVQLDTWPPEVGRKRQREGYFILLTFATWLTSHGCVSHVTKHSITRTTKRTWETSTQGATQRESSEKVLPSTRSLLFYLYFNSLEFACTYTCKSSASNLESKSNSAFHSSRTSNLFFAQLPSMRFSRWHVQLCCDLWRHPDVTQR